ncbi:DUF6293 family protein [Halorubrum ezzemoulense]|uniref:HFX_2341 family transcriptional regulator domain-containing protein n=1 Tax=Halorubrum ezzemoulense TaxID=337243 RepID=UPI00232F9121|nr:DUF6293 family protein [Halorubrum ezzemoulense]MDB9247922.1 DUF6293 family protein [Halorubrum ezzemoulense]MDB9258169.1 DUF6293 family protein [Halorubrum ezzemoulense]MDB9261469.1 DUF6293 family protein [Halorubrum ezzemoulense]MDB9264972.1 DUF6293 family protein [Halorubrum ezzemoulense]MDB9268530.1 DUF6293 family protein [Halorubrum ezzemoulense]
MTERVHIIPVGFDFERLIYPISQGQMEADRVVLITHEGDPDDEATNKAAELASNMTRRLEDSFKLIDIEVERESVDIEDMFDYETLYPMAYDYILNELKAENEVFVNIASMPRTVAFAFATAADSIIAEFHEDMGEIRDRLHTYYVSPEEYLVHRMMEVLENAADTLDELKQYEDLTVHSQYEEIVQLLDRINESGVTEGARDLDGQMYVEFPSSPGSNVEDFEQTILNFLSGRDPISSTSALAEQLAEETGEEYDESFRSRVQYNVSKLDEKGYVDRKRVGNRLETQLSTMGRMWVKTHPE